MKSKLDLSLTAHGRFGYTLIEIMIVVLTIAVLTCIAVPSYTKVRTIVRQNEAEHYLLIFAAAIDKLAYDTGRFPGTAANPAPLRTWYSTNAASSYKPDPVTDLTSSNAGLCAYNSSYNTNTWKGPYIGTNALPLDPWGTPYWFDPCYIALTNGQSVSCAAVGSSGPDHVRGHGGTSAADDQYEIIQTY